MELPYLHKQATKKVCHALDGIKTIVQLEQRIEDTQEYVGMYKVGLELFKRFGHEPLEIIKKHKKEIFLDLKDHDIPKTMYEAAFASAEQRIYMFTVHASSGLKSLEAAAKGARDGALHYNTKKPKVIGVTVLTSLNDEDLKNELNINKNVQDQVNSLSQLSIQAGLDGLVCSALDLESIREYLPQDFMKVTPGIKSPGTKGPSDQKRVATPKYALNQGSNLLIIGRAMSDHPTSELKKQAGYDILDDIVNG